jgi:hypothetical protein
MLDVLALGKTFHEALLKSANSLGTEKALILERGATAKPGEKKKAGRAFAQPAFES